MSCLYRFICLLIKYYWYFKFKTKSLNFKLIVIHENINIEGELHLYYDLVATNYF